MIWHGIIEKYREFLPVGPRTPVVTLNEGNTPLVFSKHLSDILGVAVHLKCEGLNPTGSFKDRGMTVALSKAVEAGARLVICASTGNTSASAAAYSAKAGIGCVVLIPRGAIALGKLSQALVHGAKVLALDGNFDKALQMVREIARRHGITLVNSVNPYRLDGQKTGAFEVCDQLDGRAPDFHVMPVGNAGNITAYWKGYTEYHRAGRVKTRPRMIGFQAEGAAPIVRGKIIARPVTIASAIRIGNPASWKSAEAARDESGGLIGMVSDREILEAYRFLAAKEGVFVEPASAAGVAGILKLGKKKFFRRGSGATVVCVLTGHGLKDPDRALASAKKPKGVPARLESIMKAIRA
ncbi:MAG: threonine synthase [Candidatus Omnitrophica bacterium]|nr:threonine synthase [Candidatus Omnitrophota bacterium]